jgi:hypothetical protein
VRHVQLEVYNDEHGNTGLIIVGTEKVEGIMADFQGGLIAHDLLEHQNGVDKIGCPADELEAVGGMWQVRGRWGRLGERSIYDPEQVMAHEIARIVVELTGDGWWPGTVRYRTRAHYEDETFDAILEMARKEILDELRYHDNGGDPFPVDQFLADAKHLMRMGYRKAERRFGTWASGSRLYDAVKEVVGRYAKNLEEWQEGQRYRLSYGNGEARCVPLLHADDAW